MDNFRLPMSLCAAVAGVLRGRGSHATLDALFEAAGAPGPPPDLSHDAKWKMWLFRIGNDPNADSLAVLGNVIEEFMDLPPSSDDIFAVDYPRQRERLNNILEECGLRYFRGGRVLPNGELPPIAVARRQVTPHSHEPQRPSTVEELLLTLVRGLPRAMHPFIHRRRGANSLSFESEYDIQDLLHSQLRPWVADIRPEEFTPSYAGTSTRMDFLLPAHKMVLETKRVRDKSHAKKIGDELIIDIEHYRRHKDCDHLWCVVYDPQQVIQNPSGLISDIEGNRSTPDGAIQVRVFVFSG
jgi:hypothetical protein